MEWTEISVVTDHAGAEFVAALFTDEFAAKGVVIDDAALVNRYIDSGAWDYTSLTKSDDEDRVTVTAYFPKGGATNEKISRLQKRLLEAGDAEAGLREAKIICADMADEDWSETWKQYFHVTKIGENFVVTPPWEEYAPKENEIVLVIDPGQAFGTGSHPTTALCLAALEKMDLAGKTVFDIGTGSGILATAAAKKRAAKIIAVDNDETAIKAATENAALNRVASAIKFSTGDLLTGIDGKADVIIANIVADVILRLLPDAATHLNAGGVFLTGGIIDDRVEEVCRAAESCGFRCEETNAAKEWRSLIFVRAEGKDE